MWPGKVRPTRSVNDVMTPSIVNRLVAIVLVNVLWSTAGCAKNDDQQSGDLSILLSQVNSTPTAASADQKNQTFGAFLSELSTLVKTNNLEGLADITDFPLTIRGELDDDGSVEIDRTRFVNLIGEFLQDEVYLIINDELVTSTYRDLMIKPIDKPEIDGDAATLHGFHFVRREQHWKLEHITTYVHIVERFSHGGGK
jgi:hypothetical protein